MNNVEKYISLLEDEEYISKVYPSIYLEGFVNVALSDGYNIKGFLL